MTRYWAAEYASRPSGVVPDWPKRPSCAHNHVAELTKAGKPRKVRSRIMAYRQRGDVYVCPKCGDAISFESNWLRQPDIYRETHCYGWTDDGRRGVGWTDDDARRRYRAVLQAAS